MTNGEKATALLSYLEKFDTKTAINVLHPLIDDETLAARYDEMIANSGAELIALYDNTDECWETLAEEYQNFDLSSFVERARIIAPHVFLPKPETTEIDGEIQDGNGTYILTWEDGIGDIVRIYKM